ncbi:MAG: RND transporter, partial [Pseudomonadota bacterium]
MSDAAEKRSFRFTFGLERLGLVALNRPTVSLGLIALLTVLAVFGVMQLKVDDSLSELFRSDSREFRQYEEVDRRFPSSEFDVLAVIEGEGVLTRKGLTAISEAAFELQLADGISGMVSMMSARERLNEAGYAAPVVPETLPQSDAELATIVARLKANEIVKGTFLSDDGKLALMVISLD